MITLLETLVAEHDRILTVVGALRDFASLHAEDEPDARGVLAEFVRYLHDYVDAWHHAKEERLLFEVLLSAGFPRDSGPVACMLREHDLGRGTVRALEEIAGHPGPLSPTELAQVKRLGAAFSELLATHIAKENQMLYPMAARLLPAEIFAELDQASAALSAQRRASTVDLEVLGETLAARYGAVRVGAAPTEARRP